MGISVTQSLGCRAQALLESHCVALGFLALMLVVLVLLNLCCTRVLLQRIGVDGRYYQRVSVDDLDEDYAVGGDAGTARRRNAASLEMQDFQIGSGSDDGDKP